MKKISKKAPKKAAKKTSKKVPLKTTKKAVKKVAKKAPKKAPKKSVKKVSKTKSEPLLLVKDIVLGDVIAVDESKTIRQVVQILTIKKVGAVIILDENLDGVGIFTERDLLTKVVAENVDLDTVITEVMTENFYSVTNDDLVRDLPAIMLARNFRHLPITNGKKVIGMISIRDIVRLLLLKK